MLKLAPVKWKLRRQRRKKALPPPRVVAERRLAGSQPRRKSMPTSTKKVRYAVVGLGYIAQGAVLPAFSHARENSELVALVSGSTNKLRKLAKEFRVAAYTYEQYQDCLESGDIDAVYIALPN